MALSQNQLLAQGRVEVLRGESFFFELVWEGGQIDLITRNTCRIDCLYVLRMLRSC